MLQPFIPVCQVSFYFVGFSSCKIPLLVGSRIRGSCSLALGYARRASRRQRARTPAVFSPGAGVVSCFTSRRDWISSLTYRVRHGPDLNPDQTATRALGSFIRPRGPVLWDVPCRTARLPHALGARRTPPFRSRARTCLKWKRPGVCWPPPRFSAFSSHFGRSVFPCELQYLIAELHKMADSFTGIALNLKLTKN